MVSVLFYVRGGCIDFLFWRQSWNFFTCIIKSTAAVANIVNDQYIEMYSKPGETIQKLNEQMRSIQSVVAGADQPTGDADDLLKKFGYISEGVPSSR